MCGCAVPWSWVPGQGLKLACDVCITCSRTQHGASGIWVSDRLRDAGPVTSCVRGCVRGCVAGEERRLRRSRLLPRIRFGDVGSDPGYRGEVACPRHILQNKKQKQKKKVGRKEEMGGRRFRWQVRASWDFCFWRRLRLVYGWDLGEAGRGGGCEWALRLYCSSLGDGRCDLVLLQAGLRSIRFTGGIMRGSRSQNDVRRQKFSYFP